MGLKVPEGSTGLTEPVLAGPVLMGPVLMGAVLMGAVLMGAVLMGAVLMGAVLTGPWRALGCPGRRGSVRGARGSPWPSCSVPSS
jgi:hypothetical protein